ncbi:hypothetical protein [Paracoccus sediminilitoris]|uniref:hypothetical protein n=1 Tax=Paracoccus sediminilitoris TaxID=2202419 RepID=UPI0013141238|nr:hypothetical protein [Paracoccus sediminilitoris]
MTEPVDLVGDAGLSAAGRAKVACFDIKFWLMKIACVLARSVVTGTANTRVPYH